MDTQITVEDLKQLMADRGYTQADLTRRLGVKQGTVNHWLAGRRSPTGWYATKVRQLIDETAVLRDGTPSVSGEELRTMINRLTAALAPEAPSDATPEQRAYARGGHDMLHNVLETLLTAMYTGGPTNYPPVEKKTKEK